MIIERVCGREVKITSDMREADLVLVYPYIVGSWRYKLKWVADFALTRLGREFSDGPSDKLRWLFGVGDKRVIFVSHENMDRPYWWNMIGKFLIRSSVPRLTFWPKIVDPIGQRFPYWYNYVDWPQYPRRNFYDRFGCLYRIRDLMAPLSVQQNRKNVAVAIGSHLDHPRSALLRSVQNSIGVDCYGTMGEKFGGPKINLMRLYRYAFCPENSTGYGYDTEKLPEAWVAGCVPVGFFSNPYSDFNPMISGLGLENESRCYEQPLLLEVPSLIDIERYVRGLLR